jgi:PIN domain nuclease of toxin-antitoxin system
VEGHAEVILLDTHVLLWLALEPVKLSSHARESISVGYEQGGVAISAITLWELAWLATHGRIRFTGTPDALVESIASRVAIRPITPKIAILANQLPATYSSDPCDRLIGGTALSEGIPLVTKDRNIRGFEQIKTVW